ncbi:MAG: hypothetical protein Q9220_004065 [cf. Caloplaca sp. 1 TL-2023]
MNLTGYAGVAMIILVLFFESGIFSIIFAMCLRGLGSHTKMGSVVLTAATSGGAVIPVILSPVNDSRGIRYGFCVPLAVFVFGLLLPLYTTIIPAARQQVDREPKQPVRHSDQPATLSGFSRAFPLWKRKRKVSESSTEKHIEKRELEGGG